MNRYLYLLTENEAPIMITAKHKPSEKNIPSRGTWVVKVWYDEKWMMPAFPEVTWGTLKTLKFIGRIK